MSCSSRLIGASTSRPAACLCACSWSRGEQRGLASFADPQRISGESCGGADHSDSWKRQTVSNAAGVATAFKTAGRRVDSMWSRQIILLLIFDNVAIQPLGLGG
mmetsp:Transcript_13365/g.33736  ORF Transcript_13365/g.33736 Transcript_13365/m.33736 type:complete len:104 (-) Transcript_13365:425-736(-)